MKMKDRKMLEEAYEAIGYGRAARLQFDNIIIAHRHFMDQAQRIISQGSSNLDFKETPLYKNILTVIEHYENAQRQQSAHPPVTRKFKHDLEALYRTVLDPSKGEGLHVELLRAALQQLMRYLFR